MVDAIANPEFEAQLAVCNLIWEMPDTVEMRCQARVWLHKLRDSRYYARGFMAPVVMSGIQGVIVAASTNETTNRFKESMEEYLRNGYCGNPSWMMYPV